MSVPTFSSIEPSEGSAQGRFLVMITGSNFRIPDPAPLLGYVGGAEPRTLRVTIDGEEAISAYAMSDTQLVALLPAYRGDPDVETIPASVVTIENLDNDGNPIPGESVTAADAFTYLRPQLDGATSLQWIVRSLLREFKRQVFPNTVLTTHTDFDDTTGDALNIVALAKLPALVLTGPDLRKNTFYSEHGGVQISSGARSSDRKQAPRTVDLLFELIGAADNSGVLLNLMAAVESFFERNKFLVVDRNPDDAGAGRVQYEMELTADAAVQSRSNESNVRHFLGAFEIRGFDVELDTVARSWTSDYTPTDGEVVLQIEPLEESV